jgi:uncharacterized protein YndB with AHSA1/START domain
MAQILLQFLARVFQTVVDSIGEWWSPQHTYSGNSHNMSIEATAGGCFCERLPSGGGVQHMTVEYIEPGKLLRLAGALGPLQESGASGAMTWKFTEQSNRTSLEVTYAVSGYQPQGFQQLAPAVDGVMAEQLQRLKAFVETGHADSKQ